LFHWHRSPEQAESNELQASCGAPLNASPLFALRFRRGDFVFVQFRQRQPYFLEHQILLVGIRVGGLNDLDRTPV